MVKIRTIECPKDKYNIKCPYPMMPTRIVVHNTANDAPAKNEIAYMHSNNMETSFHFAVDDVEAVQGISLDRNAWHASDGGNGKGNREGIAIEICYSKSGGEKFIKAEQNAVELIVDILKRYGWGIDKVTKHQDYCGKYCPHRTLDMGWDRFIKMIEDKLIHNDPVKSVDELAKEVIQGKWGNGEARKQALGDRYAEVQKRVDEMLGEGEEPKKSVEEPKKNVEEPKKSVEEIAREVIQGKYGNGEERKNKLTQAGYDYAEVQARVDALLNGETPNEPVKSVDELAREVIQGKYGNGEARKQALGNRYAEVQAKVDEILTDGTTTPQTKSVDELAKEVIQGKWGNGEDRKNRLTQAGYNYNEVQARVDEIFNEMLG